MASPPLLSKATRRALLVPLRALQLGAAYAAKVRLPHALVMALLFSDERRPSVLLPRVLGLAYEHAKLLAIFAFLYKSGISVGRFAYEAMGRQLASPPGVPAVPWHAFVAGALAAQFVWAKYSHLNYQILLYLLSRAIVAAVKLAAKHGVVPFSLIPFSTAYPVLAVATWGAVMYMYERDPAVLHPSLANSMHDIYRASNSETYSLLDYVPSPATAVLLLWLLLEKVASRSAVR